MAQREMMALIESRHTKGLLGLTEIQDILNGETKGRTASGRDLCDWVSTGKLDKDLVIGFVTHLEECSTAALGGWHE